MDDNKNIVSKDKLLQAGVYFGHKKSTWNPKMKPYIAKTQKGTHILDIDKTKKTLEFAYSIVKGFAEKGASFIFVGTRKQAKKVVMDSALRTNSFYVTERWLGGTFTNTRTIFQRVRRMDHLERLQAKSYEGYTKKEGLLFDKELAKLQRNLQGIRTMRRRPNIMIIADPSHDMIAVKEAKKLGVKVIGIVDSNNDPSSVDIAIPANDDSLKSVTLIITILADAIVAAKGGDQLFAFKEDSEIVLPEDPKRVRTFDNNRRGFNNNRSDSKFRPSNRFNSDDRNSKSSFRKNPVESSPRSTEVKTEIVTGDKPANEKVAIKDMKVLELRNLAKEKKIEGYSTLKKEELISALS